MEPTAFKVRRVLMGVVVGLVLVSLAFYGWVQYRRSEYAQHEHDLLSRFHDVYTMCVTAGNGQARCADRVLDACTADAFWATGKPFSLDATAAAPDRVTRCRAGVLTG